MLHYVPVLYVYIVALHWISVSECGLWTKWSSWSACSATCGPGVQVQTRNCFRLRGMPCLGWSSQNKACAVKLCPSYLGKPRIHFSGEFVSDVTTVNNMRLMFDPDQFCPRCSKNNVEIYNKAPKLSNEGVKEIPEHTIYQHNPFWNSMGSNHFYFQKTYVTSTCWEEETNCVINDPIVGRKVENPFDGRIVDLDVDWQTASTIFAFHVHIPGVLKSKMERSAVTNICSRSDDPEDVSDAGKFKSKLIDIVWLDSYFARKFKNAKSLSISFTVDMFVNKTVTGRVTGTIGMTSLDDPKNIFGGRVMKPKNVLYDLNHEVPFYVDRNSKVLTMDFSLGMPSDRKGRFSSSFASLANIFLIVVLNPSQVPYSEHFTKKLSLCSGYTALKLTQEGDLDYLFQQDWYMKFGGVIQISLKNLSNREFNLLSNNQIGIIDEAFLNKHHEKTFTNLNEHELTALSVKCRVIFLENEYGINLKYFNDFTKSLSFKQAWNVSVIASQWGHPAVGARANLNVMKRSARLDDVGNRCHPFLSEPQNILDVGLAHLTNIFGMAQFTVKAAKKIRSPRKCGLDGQVYPLGIILTYMLPDQKLYRYGEGGMFVADDNTAEKIAKTQCGLDVIYATMTSAVKVYSSLPKSMMRKECPTWSDDVKPIFYFYSNIAPVMAKREIINLKSIVDVRSKLEIINMSMFGYDFDHPNFMPVTRDLSPDKTEVIRKWLTCEIKGKVVSDTQQNKKTKMAINLYATCGNSKNYQKTLSRIRDLLQLAMWIELYTIPPYLTAYFSVKTKSKTKVRSLLKSVATEEMLHLSLAANLLNAVGGTPHLTDLFWLPHYPTFFPSKSFIQVLPDLELNLEKFSSTLARNMFSEIEKPASFQVYNIFRTIAALWKALPTTDHFENTTTSSGTFHREEKFKKISSIFAKGEMLSALNSGFWRKAFKFASRNKDILRKSELDSIGGLYSFVMLHLIQVESCVKIKNRNYTIFGRNTKRQLDSEQWYVTHDLTKGRLFSVSNLKTALEALLEISYEGEGGIACSPFISASGEDLDGMSLNIESKSHFIKFQELAFERELIALTKPPPPWEKLPCMEHKSDQCGCIFSNGTVSYSTQKQCLSFCFAGQSLSVEPEEEIWFLQSLPQRGNFSLSQNVETSRIADHFDQIYTNLLHCLEIVFNGNPHHMRTCMGNMYELLNIGEQLVQMPIYDSNGLTEPVYPLPRWKYIRDHYKSDERLETSRSLDKTGYKFC